MPFRINPFTGTLSPVIEGDGTGIDVSTSNPKDILYIKGDEFTDGSIRIIFTIGDEDSHVESRANGVWNDTSFRFNAGSVEIGRDLKIEAAADFIKTNNPSGFDIHSTALIPHIPFNDNGTESPHTPITDTLAPNVIFSGAVSEVLGTTLSQIFPITFSQIIKNIVYEVGTVGSTTPIQHTIYKGTDNTGDIISRINLPANKFIANTTATIDFGSAFGFSEKHVDIFIELISDIAFTLKTNSGGNILITLNSQKLETRDLVYDDLVLSNELELVFSNELELTYSNQF